MDICRIVSNFYLAFDPNYASTLHISLSFAKLSYHHHINLGDSNYTREMLQPKLQKQRGPDVKTHR